MSRRPLKYRREESANGTQTEASAIRGPNSALTEFLRQQGISAEEIRQRHLRRVAGEEATLEDAPGVIEINRETEPDQRAEEEEQEPDQEELEIRIAARRKRRAARDNNDGEYTDSDSEDNLEQEDNHIDQDAVERARIVGDEVECFRCSTSFVVSVYSEQDPETGGYYCVDCLKMKQENDRAIRKNQLASRKKRQRLAVALLDRQDVKIPSLQDISIKRITERIEDVDELGDIGAINMKKIAKIICRNRSLNDTTLSLFLNTAIEVLELWDCSKITKDSYDKICSFAPNIKKLTVLMCGRFHNDNLNYYATNFKNLTSLELDGPFLINNQTWQSFFKVKGKDLTSFKVSNTHRFDDTTLETLLQNVDAEKFQSLKLSRLAGIKFKDSYDMIPMYLTNLFELEISYPEHEELVDDSMLINTLSINGESLNTLVLDGCAGLTDEFLINGIKPFASKLRKLSLQFLDQITDEGFVGLFHEWHTNLGLNEVFLKKCFSLGDAGILEMFLHSNTTLVELSLNSVKDLTVLPFQVMRCNNLIYLDIGFIRSIDDRVLELIQKNCKQVKIIDCYGNNKCTAAAKIREDVKVIGRQSDTLW
ncbi:hypothetical protein WICPIJ_000302 [Wickerhamomyces pijperi]|uniref:DNA repair protein RAD7 n=1 Tax=Wickerhamomyces pijperi TaxID=599730 RepID=A0A9P8QDT5_WICPI|nr:hypothetical protein WICPIJ_000302 [Wickerhamomyces pijperi]